MTDELEESTRALTLAERFRLRDLWLRCGQLTRSERREMRAFERLLRRVRT